MMKQDFVVFNSPGTFLSEKTVKPIDSWDVNKAIELSYSVIERYDATPYGFYFITKERGEADLDSKVSEESNFYYLGGEVLTLQELKERDNPEDEIFIQNMEMNNWDKCIINTNSWKTMQPLRKTDVVLKYTKVLGE